MPSWFHFPSHERSQRQEERNSRSHRQEEHSSRPHRQEERSTRAPAEHYGASSSRSHVTRHAAYDPYGSSTRQTNPSYNPYTTSSHHYTQPQPQPSFRYAAETYTRAASPPRGRSSAQQFSDCYRDVSPLGTSRFKQPYERPRRAAPATATATPQYGGSSERRHVQATPHYGYDGYYGSSSATRDPTRDQYGAAANFDQGGFSSWERW
jgi:hypothetical protein